MSKLNKDESVILSLLSQLPRPIGRTAFVKMVYLVDNLHSEHLGTPITGFHYHWDHYGPNATGNQIVTTLESLSERGLVKRTSKLTPYENVEYTYAAADKDVSAKLPLSADEWLFISAVVKEYGSKTRAQVVKAAKATLPMQGIEQYAPLVLQLNPAIQERQERILSNQKLMEQVEKSFEEGESGISLEELRASCGKSP